jgi:hypothetical protein
MAADAHLGTLQLKGAWFSDRFLAAAFAFPGLIV